MANALDTFREHRVAAGQAYAALTKTSELVRGLQSQVNALTRIDELKTLLQQQRPLASGGPTASWRRCDGCAMMRCDASGRRSADGRSLSSSRWHPPLQPARATHGRTRPCQAELTALRSRISLAEFVEHRVFTMTPAERRQLDVLMRWNVAPRQ
jgi:hypothetical protein